MHVYLSFIERLIMDILINPALRNYGNQRLIVIFILWTTLIAQRLLLIINYKYRFINRTNHHDRSIIYTILVDF